MSNKSTLKSFKTFLLKNPDKRKNKKYDTKYVLKSLDYSIQKKERIYLNTPELDQENWKSKDPMFKPISKLFLR